MERDEISDLLQAYLNGTATDAQRRMVELHYLDYLDSSKATPSNEQLDRSFDTTYRLLQSAIGAEKKPIKKRLGLRALPYAAAVLLICGVASVWYVNYKAPVVDTVVAETDSILPGRNRALLTVEGGEPVILDETQDGVIMKDGAISYTDGRLITTVNLTAKRYTLQTPNGGTYQLQLPDGTKVWLNAASRIVYAADFGRSSYRKVQLEGEAYFEVAKDKSRPFSVETARERVEVLGTHFNVNSYSDEATSRTTLLEGAVRINLHTVLQPGQQAIVEKRGALRIAIVETDRIVAWKQGKFVFESEELESVMQKIGRWYDVEVTYDGSVSNKTFSGTVSRFEDIHKLLNMITYTSNVRFKLEGRRITVMP